MRTFKHTTLLTARMKQTGRGRLAPLSLRYNYTYALTFWTFGGYLYLCLDRGWCQVR